MTLLPVSEIARKCNISRSSVYRIIKQTFNKGKNKSNGRPRIMSEKDERHIARTLVQLRRTEGTISCSRVASGCTSNGTHVCPGGRTVKFSVAISYGVGVVFCL